MNNLTTRTITGIGFLVVIIGSIILGQIVFATLFLFVTYLGLREFFQLTGNNNIRPFSELAIGVGMFVYLSLALFAAGYIQGEILLLNIPLLLILIIAELWRKQDNPFQNIAISVLGVVYIAIPFGLMNFFFDPVYANGPRHYGILLGYLIILWTSDTGAYVFGSLLGKHRLFERISPKKSWEGSLGGALVSLLAAWGLSHVYIMLSPLEWLLLAILTIVFGTLGDLSESLLKRSLNIKDSGNILPGHGGILDRFDAVLMSVPFVFVFLTLFCKH